MLKHFTLGRPGSTVVSAGDPYAEAAVAGSTCDFLCLSHDESRPLVPQKNLFILYF